MKNELCFQVDEEDNIIGTLTKYESHRLDPATSKAPLHRAFSAFLVKPDTHELLLQRRSDHKLTFPLLWANSCCSHPIAGLQEDTADIITGVAKAARRKLQHELGIPVAIVTLPKFNLVLSLYRLKRGLFIIAAVFYIAPIKIPGANMKVNRHIPKISFISSRSHFDHVYGRRVDQIGCTQF